MLSALCYVDVPNVHNDPNEHNVLNKPNDPNGKKVKEFNNVPSLSNVLVWNDTQKIIDEVFKVLDGKGKKGCCPEMWAGKASERIVNVLTEYLKT